MTIEEKLMTYKEGFRDGWKDGYEQGRRDASLLTPLPYNIDYYTDRCKICGRSGVSAVVCSVPTCPTRVTSSGAAGEIGKWVETGNHMAGASGGSTIHPLAAGLAAGANGPSIPLPPNTISLDEAIRRQQSYEEYVKQNYNIKTSDIT
jgi:hypothetical protein